MLFSNIDTIFFDVGNTLLFQNHQRTLAALHDRGISPSKELLAAIERKTKPEFDAQMVNGGKADHGFWWMFYSHLLNKLGISDPAVHEALVGATRLSENWSQCRSGTREILEDIGKRYRIGVISNADGKIAEVLTHCQLADCFLTITDSGLVGHEKPAGEIFAAALAEMGASAETSLYVGDVYSVDYRGATQAGMEAVLFDVSGAYRDKGLPRVEHLQELNRQLVRDR
jgi:HAD superfamily hydrolase (TIGR01509 family)